MNNLTKNLDYSTQLQVSGESKDKIISYILIVVKRNSFIIKSMTSLTGSKDIDLIIPSKYVENFFSNECIYYSNLGKIGHIKFLRYTSVSTT